MSDLSDYTDLTYHHEICLDLRKHFFCLDLPCFDHCFCEVKLRNRGVDNPISLMINNYEYYHDAKFFVDESFVLGTTWAANTANTGKNEILIL